LTVPITSTEVPLILGQSNTTCPLETALIVTLDLNGHTLTYDTALPLGVANPRFEEGSETAD